MLSIYPRTRAASSLLQILYSVGFHWNAKFQQSRQLWRFLFCPLLSEQMCVCVRVCVSVCVCVCVWERQRERERECVCLVCCERVCICVFAHWQYDRVWAASSLGTFGFAFWLCCSVEQPRLLSFICIHLAGRATPEPPRATCSQPESILLAGEARYNLRANWAFLGVCGEHIYMYIYIYIYIYLDLICARIGRFRRAERVPNKSIWRFVWIFVRFYSKQKIVNPRVLGIPTISFQLKLYSQPKFL